MGHVQQNKKTFVQSNVLTNDCARPFATGPATPNGQLVSRANFHGVEFSVSPGCFGMTLSCH